MQRSLITAISIVLLMFGGAHAGITDGLVGWYPLDGDFNDATGNGNDGTFMGTDTNPNFTAGKFGQGIDLDGVDQFVELANPASFDFAGQDFSVSAWFRVDGFTKSWQALVAKGEGNRWRVHRRGGEGILTWNGGNADVPAYVPGDFGLNDLANDEFHHIAGVSDMTNGEVRMYIDGALVATGPAPAVENSAMPVMIGENPDARGRTWDGVIDDVGIWGRALTEAEVGQLANAIPEPSSAVLALIGGLALLRCRRRKA